MTVDLFAGVPVTDLQASLVWYEKLLGSPPSFLPNKVEAVWTLDEHQYVYIELLPEHAGHSRLTLFVDNLDERISGITERGIEPAFRETYDNGVTKITYRDADGNEIGFGGGPS